MKGHCSRLNSGGATRKRPGSCSIEKPCIQARRSRGDAMSVLVRAIACASVLVTLVLALLPAWVLEWSGVAPSPPIGPRRNAAIAITVFGAANALSRALTFAWTGKGTEPFGPPRRLGVRGPYAFVRNPMYTGSAFSTSPSWCAPATGASGLSQALSPTLVSVCLEARLC